MCFECWSSLMSRNELHLQIRAGIVGVDGGGGRGNIHINKNKILRI